MEISVKIRILKLPIGVREAIEVSLRRGDDPDEEWRYEDRARNGRWECRFASVRGETFSNSDGISRQEIIEAAAIGAPVLLIPEPTNAYDPEATAVYVDLDDGRAGQIGYLPRGLHLGSSLQGDVAVWLARKSRSPGGQLGAVLYVVIEELPMD